MDAPTRLDAVRRQPGERVVWVQAPEIASRSDRRVAGVLAGRCHDIEVDPLEELAPREAQAWRLPDETAECDVPDARSARTARGNRQARMDDRDEHLDAPVPAEGDVPGSVENVK